MAATPKQPVCLIVIDGWGVSEEVHGNAIANAETPVMDEFAKHGSPEEGHYLTLDASGLAVGLPAGLMGNSEVGHLNIGAGRVIYQDIVRINLDCESKAIHKNANFVAACERAKTVSGGRLQLLGLVSDGGVHAHIEHLYSLLEGAKVNGVPTTYVHFFSDGRDTSPTSGAGFVQAVLDRCKALGYGSLATIMGRYYAMDRDKRWERIQLAVEGLVDGVGEKTTPEEVVAVVKKNYANNVTDEFLKPIIVNSEGLLRDNDTLVFIDYRADRMRQITETIGIKTPFEKANMPKGLELFTMTEYKKEFPFRQLYPATVPKNVLAEVVSAAGWPQFHTAETEKYAHVTFFFNGGQEKAFPGEERQLVSSPKVATYDLQPEMSCAGVGEAVAAAVATKKYPFVMCNFAPPDMVGHTGKYEPAVKACAATDRAIGVIKAACEAAGYALLITADHGNAEKMYDDKGGPLTSHTTNRVPFVLHNTTRQFAIPPDHNAALCDVAPTVLDLLGLAIPAADMTGKSLLKK
ncbi:PREDICTED: 2,3-bisphosphoglycerate-independent phosphoglycerate mutase-like [Rhagoletis zephyria]|uniref:2,3-bisphosphoglycerate-independent phosphoglycerate mutase-like n=1 Tax=Rhagoletis zephyria TaxID=28612 RepID=UPI0008114D13|nr:PREDICTED: 2,3-bisphosphoglycerate-independent phosphoglycerate mutase-like [Rhagoletis zephyria]